MDQIQDLIGSTRPAAVVHPPRSVEVQGKVEEISSFKDEYAVALVLGDDLLDNAQSWKDLSWQNMTNVTLLWLLILSIEDPELGSGFIDVDKNATPGLYMAVVKARARQAAHLSPAFGDKELISKFIIATQSFNRQHLEDILQQIPVVQEEDCEKRKKKPKKKKKEEEPEEPEGAEPQQKKAKQYPDIHSIVATGNRLSWRLVAGTIQHDLAVSGEFAQSALLNKNGPVTQPKASFTVMPCTNLNGVVVGYLIRVFSFDPAWNVGELIHKLVKQSELREKNKNNPHFRDPWPQYKFMQGSLFPTANFRWERWLKIMNAVYGDIPTFDRFSQQMGLEDRADNYNSRAHPKNVCKLSYALDRLRRAGARNCDSAALFVRDGNVATWPTTAYRYHPCQVKWDHETQSAFITQNLPGVNKNKLNDELEDMLRNSVNVSRAEVINNMPKFTEYNTNNLLVLMPAEADEAEEHCARLYPANYYELFKQRRETADAVRYQQEVRRQADIWTQKFVGVWPLEGSTDYLNIPGEIKAIIKWLQKYLNKHNKVVTREIQLVDKDMSFLGNAIAKQIIQTEKISRIVQPCICVKLSGHFSVYQRRVGQILYNSLYVGDPNSGKSYITVGYMDRFCIPMTFKTIDRVSMAGDQTDQGVFDQMRGAHEVEEAYVNSEVERSNKEKVNIKKTALTSGKVTTKTLEFVSIPGFMRLRASKETVQAQNYTEIWCSNTAPDETAMASRLDIDWINSQDTPTEEMKYNVDTEDKKATVDDFRMKQALSCIVYKAMAFYMLGCREPFKQLFLDIAAGMIQRLRAWQVLDKFQGSRALEIAEPLAIQLTIENAIHCCYNTVGGPQYGKPFTIEGMKDLAPYLYINSEITLLTFTLTRNKWVRVDCGTLLKAAFEALTGEKYNKDKSMYQYYATDLKKRIKFKTDRNLNYNARDDGRLNKELIDLNYLEYDGTLSQFAIYIQQYTNPHMGVTVIEAICKYLSKRVYKPRRSYLEGIKCDDLSKHRCVLANKAIITSYNDITSKVNAFAQEYARVYMKQLLQRCNSIDSFQYRTKEQVRALMSVFSEAEVMFLWLLKDHISVTPTINDLRNACNTWKGKAMQEVITPEQMQRLHECITTANLNGLNADNVYATFPGTVVDAVIILYGLEIEYFAERRNDKMQFVKLPILDGDHDHFATEDDIPQMIRASIPIIDLTIRNKVRFSPMAIALFEQDIIIDAFLDTIMCSSTLPQKYLVGWPHPQDSCLMPVIDLKQEHINAFVENHDRNLQPGGVSRRAGVTFKRRGYVESAAKEMLYGIEYGPDQDRVKHKSSIETVENLDYWAAAQQMLLCGGKFSDPVRDPRWIRQNYINHGGKLGNANFPTRNLEERLRTKKDHWDVNAPAETRAFVNIPIK